MNYKIKKIFMGIGDWGIQSFEGFPKYLRGRSEGLDPKIQFEFEGLV